MVERFRNGFFTFAWDLFVIKTTFKQNYHENKYAINIILYKQLGIILIFHSSKSSQYNLLRVLQFTRVDNEHYRQVLHYTFPTTLIGC